MRRGGGLFILVGTSLLACTLNVRGRCESTADCREGSSCSLDGVCVAAGGTCSPACAAGQICASGSCVNLKPVVTVDVTPQTMIGPAAPVVKVNVDIAPTLQPGKLVVEVSTDHVVASGSIATAAQGVNSVPIGGFQQGAQGAVSVVAKLEYSGNGASAVAGSPSAGATIDVLAPGVTTFVQTPADANGWFRLTGTALDVRAQANDGTGSGVQSASLTLPSCPGASTGPCVYAGTPVGAPVNGLATFSFTVPRNVQVAGAEAPLPYTVRAVDAMGNEGTVSGVLQIDAKAPAGTLVHVDYVAPTLTPCGAPQSATSFQCGRISSPSGTVADQLLRDDAAPVWFEAWDCGVGLAGPPTITIAGAGTTTVPQGALVETTSGPAPCGAGSAQIHRYTFTFRSADYATALGNPDPATGLMKARLTAAIPDGLGNALPPQTPGATGDGNVVVGSVRWKSNVGGKPVGSLAVMPASRRVVIATDATTNNLFALEPNGSTVAGWPLTVSSGIGGDPAVGEDGNVYVVSGDRPCPAPSTSRCGTLTIVNTAATPVAAIGCGTQIGSPFPASPALMKPAAGANDLALVISGSTRDAATLANNAFIYQLTAATTCSLLNSPGQLFTLAGELGGGTASAGLAFFSNPASPAPATGGFTAYPVTYAGAPAPTATYGAGTSFSTAAATAPPSIATTAPPPTTLAPQAVFAGSGDNKLHRAIQSGTTWTDDTPTFKTPGPSGGGSIGALTPVFDGTSIYAMDSIGTLHKWPYDTGTSEQVAAIAQPASGPVLIAGGGAVVLAKDGTLRTAIPGTTAVITTHLNVPPFLATPAAPALDNRDLAPGVAGSVAYLMDEAGWVWAVHIPGAPLAASATAWPRPGRDSCNSRSASSPCR